MELVPTRDLQDISNQLSGISESFRRKRILITGSSGFIGNWLSQSLSSFSAEFDLDLELIFVSRRIDDSFRNNIVRLGNKNNVFIESDLSSKNLSEFECFENLNLVFHAATTVTKLESKISDLDMKFATAGTSNLINLISASKAPPVLVHLSSGAVYGLHSSNPKLLSENSERGEVQNLSSYGQIKQQIEDLVNAASNSGLVMGSNPRLFSFFGPLLSLNTNFAIGNFVGNAINGRDIELTGNPNSSRSYLYIADLIRKLLLLSHKPTSDTIHLGSRNKINMAELATSVKKVINEKIDIKLLNADIPSNHYVPSVEKSNLYLDDYSEISIPEGLFEWKNWLLSKQF